MRVFNVIALLILVCCSSQQSFADSTPQVQPFVNSLPPVIDGKLDDAIWKTAAKISELTQVEPYEGVDGSRKTEIKISFDRDALYIAIKAEVVSKDEIHARNLRRDDDSGVDDQISLVLDPYNQRVRGYFFSVNPLGARADALIENDREPAYEWDAVWEAQSQINEHNWTSEWRIPFSSLGFSANQTDWAFNIERHLRYNNEVQRWSGARNQFSLNTLSEAGVITHLTGLNKRAANAKGFSVTPNLVIKENKSNNKTDVEYTPSLDANFRIRPSLNAAITINTDFAEAEIDELQSNLTRFPLFIPEQRNFFLQDAGYFGFSDFEEYPLPFFSRRIGVDAEGNPVDIRSGIKITGHEDSWNIGMLHVETESNDLLAEKNLDVVRISKQIDDSNIGLVATQGDPRYPGDANLWGLDYNYHNNDWGDKRFSLHPWVMQTESDAAGGVGEAFGAAINFPNEPWRLYVSAEHYSDRFDPALGFNPRAGINGYFFGTGYLHRSSDSSWRSIDAGANGYITTTLDHDLDSYDIYLPYIETQMADGSYWIASLQHTKEILTESFEMSSDLIIQPHTYSNLRPFIKWISPTSHELSGFIRYSFGDFYSGKLDSWRGEVVWRPSPHWYFSVGYEANRLSEFVGLDQQELTEQIEQVSFKLNWYASTRFSINNTFQYSSENKSRTFNSRLRWTLRGDNDFYLVLRKGNMLDESGLRQSNQNTIIKLGWTFWL